MQILVVVASIHLKTMKTEEGKGSMLTLFVHGLAGPKWNVLLRLKVRSWLSTKGKMFKITLLMHASATVDILKTRFKFFYRVFFSV